MSAGLWHRGWFGLALLSFLPVYAAAQTPAATSSAPPTDPAVTLPAGTVLSLTLRDALTTRSTRSGDHAHFTVREDVWVGSQLAFPRGSSVRATVTRAKRAGRIAGRAEIRLQFDELILADGTTLPFNAQLLRAGFHEVRRESEGKVRGEGNKGRDAAAVAYGGLQGVILGGSIGGKKGAAYGGLIGASVGLLGVLLERGPDLELAAGTRMDVELTRELALPLAAVQRARAEARLREQASGPTPPRPADALDAPYAESEPEVPEADSTAETTESESAPAEAAETEIAHQPEAGELEAHNRTPPPPEASGPAPTPLDDPTLSGPNAYRLRMNVELVLVEAVVRAAEGSGRRLPLEKFTREDFRLFEDGGEQTIRHFSRDKLPLAVALVVDTSGSVAPYMPELRRAALDALSQLKRGDQVALFVFTARVDRLVDLTTDRRRVARRIQRLRGSGGTNILDALWEATNYLQLAAPDRRRALILVSDNRATVRPRTTQRQVIRNALEADTVIYNIKTPGEATPLALRLPIWFQGYGNVRKIVRATGGEVFDVDRVGSVSAALQAVVERLKTRYTLGYYPTNQAHDGSFRRIEVRLTDRFGRRQHDYFVFAKRGYYAPKEAVAHTNQ